MKREEMLKKMKELQQNGSSALHLRSESIQRKQTAYRLNMLKKDVKKKSKLLVVCDLAIPFNPETGLADDEYNPDNKYRPPFSATTVALALKAMSQTNDDLKQTLMSRAGMQEWDNSNVEELTEEDWKIFRRYRVPRIFTIPVVNINIPAITKTSFGRDYAINLQRDPLTGDVIGELPIALQVNKLFRDMCYEEVSEYNSKIESGELKHDDKQQKEYKSKIYGKVPVSDDHPSNWVELIEIPLNSKFEISGDIKLEGLTPDDLKKSHHVLSKYSKNLRDAVLQFQDGDLEAFDVYFDFYEIDMNCPNEGDTATNEGKMQIGLSTKFQKAIYELQRNDNCAKICQTVRDFLDDNAEIENIVYRTTRITPYNDTLEQQIVAALPTVLSLDNKYCTTNVIKANSEIISLAFGDEGMTLIEEVEADVSDKAAGNLDEKESKVVAKEYDLNSAEFTGEFDDNFAEVETEEIPLN